VPHGGHGAAPMSHIDFNMLGRMTAKGRDRTPALRRRGARRPSTKPIGWLRVTTASHDARQHQGNAARPEVPGRALNRPPATRVLPGRNGKRPETPRLDPRPVLGYLFCTPGLSLQALPSAFPGPPGARSGQRSSLRDGGDGLRQIKLTLNVPHDLVQGCLRRNRPRPRALGLDFKLRFPIHGPLGAAG
jgi:hypothetical protein